AADVATGIRQMRDALARAGHDPGALAVAGSLRAVVEDGRLDVARTVAAVPALVEAGVTDVRLALRLPGDRAAAEDLVAEVVGAFRAVVGRTDEPARGD